MMDCGKYLKHGTLVALGIVLAASMVGCGGGETDPSESSVPETVEAFTIEDVAVTVEPTEEVTEPEEAEVTEAPEATEAEGTNGGSTEKPANTASKPSNSTSKPTNTTSKPSSSTNKPSSSSGSSASKPSNSASKPSSGGQTPPVISDGGGFNHNTNPNPKPTEPPATEPPVHVHKWVDQSTKEVGHWGEIKIVCSCGWTCTESQAAAAGMDIAEYWGMMHQEPQLAESGVRHSYDEKSQWIVDTPAVTRWVCSGCGGVSNTRPN